MSREIEFRQFKNGEMHHFGFIDRDTFVAPVSLCLDMHPVMQYTGLKDCNGVKIFEGDLIKWVFSGIVSVSEVYYCQEMAAFKQSLVSTNQTPSYDDIEYHDFLEQTIKEQSCQNISCDRWSKVIGNIHQNPELLQVNLCGK